MGRSAAILRKARRSSASADRWASASNCSCCDVLLTSMDVCSRSAPSACAVGDSAAAAISGGTSLKNGAADQLMTVIIYFPPAAGFSVTILPGWYL